ncbi:apolipoprotein N-acyltransferase [Fulvivirga sp. 29W222]|uniref:Apolipoprotein N-acyltransferase n=1 Tax=Fulvivirga marina TaxID=2494733 RepID=A0A937KES7_9BACT|nr:apolipoprotein N-acyltransferase [Fulvivirga marina]MBL6449884.1 apolipoprotein N-acyltransferase [Fulvivirga marina]
MKKKLNDNIFKCALSGLLLILGWPPFSLTPLLFVALIPLMFIIYKKASIKKVWAYSYLTFFIWTVGTMYWIANTKIDLQGFIIIAIAWILIPFFQSIPFLVFAWIRPRVNHAVVWYLLPLLWVSYEYLHSLWQFAFTWLHLGFGLSPMPWFIQFYELTGYLGGSFIVVLFNVMFFNLIREYRGNHFRRNLAISAGTFAFLIVLNLLLQPSGSKKNNAIKAAVVQSNANPYEVLDENSLKRQVGTLQRLLLPLKGKGVDIVILSEGYLRSSPLDPLILNDVDEQPSIKEIKKISKTIGAPILVGFIGFKLFDHKDSAPASALPTGDGRYFSGYNGAMLVAHDQPSQVQMKNNLVPFMERIPYLEQLSFFEKFKLSLNQAKNSYEKDDKINIFKYKQMRIGTLICLDALFPAYASHFISSKANIMAIIANDSWAGKTSGYRQNAQYASTIATSLRRDVMRCATTGKSMFVDRAGAKHKVTLWDEEVVVIDDVQLFENDTFYSFGKDWLGLVSTILSLTLFIGVLVRQRVQLTQK